MNRSNLVQYKARPKDRPKKLYLHIVEKGEGHPTNEGKSGDDSGYPLGIVEGEKRKRIRRIEICVSTTQQTSRKDVGQSEATATRRRS